MTTNTAYENIIRRVYEDFLKNNIKGIINQLADNVKWNIPGYPDNPNAGNFVGKTEVDGFFQNLSRHIKYSKFEPLDYFSSDNIIAVIGYQESTALDTGRPISGEWVMRWEFDSNGKITDFKYYEDTFLTAKAYKE